MDKERLKDLLFSYLNDTLDQEEFDELLSYINIDAYTEVFYESMDQEWASDKIKALLSDADRDLVFSRVQAEPRFAAARVKHIAKKARLLSMRIISAAAILAVISFGAYFLTTNRKAAGSSYDNDVNPGTTKAVLTLADGSKITLDGAQKGKLAEQSGMSVAKTAEGKLVYTVANADQAAADTYNTLETPKGGEYQLHLPDGTKVWLNAASSLKYPASFTNARERKVILVGEAYFEVAHNKNSPFKVVTDKQVIEVLGTHFNVNAYSNEPETKTTLLEGAVDVVQLTSNAAQQTLAKHFVLKPGQQAQVGVGIAVVNVDAETAVAWKNGDFILKDEDFKATMRRIARWYDVDVIYDESAPEDLELGGWVSRSKNISAVLKVIESTGKVHFKVQGRRITVTK